MERTIIDLMPFLLRQANLEGVQEVELPLFVSIESSLCYKQSSDLHASLKKIEAIMLENRQNYFSNAAYSFEAFTDQQRNQFDEEIKNSLSISNLKISEFKEVIDSLKTQNTTEREHMKNIAVCLYQYLKTISALFRQFLEFNEMRRRKLQSAISLDVKNEFRSRSEEPKEHKSAFKRKVSNFDEELERESKMIFMEKVEDHKQIEDTKKTLERINEVLGKMENKALEEEILTSSFREIGEVGLFHIGNANKDLVKANEISKDTGKYWTFYFLFLALSLLFLDFLKS